MAWLVRPRYPVPDNGGTARRRLLGNLEVPVRLAAPRPIRYPFLLPGSHLLPALWKRDGIPTRPLHRLARLPVFRCPHLYRQGKFVSRGFLGRVRKNPFSFSQRSRAWFGLREKWGASSILQKDGAPEMPHLFEHFQGFSWRFGRKFGPKWGDAWPKRSPARAAFDGSHVQRRKSRKIRAMASVSMRNASWP